MTRFRATVGVLVALVFYSGVAVVSWLIQYYADFSGLSTTELAGRLSRFHGVSSEPRSAVARDGMLTVTCARGPAVEFHAALPCEATFACDTLGIDAACWQPVSP